MRYAAQVLVLVGCAACQKPVSVGDPKAPGPSVGDVGPAPQILVGEFVVLRPRARIYAARRDTEPALEVSQHVVMQVVGVDGTRLAVSNIVEGDHCADVASAFSWAELKLYVESEDLASVPWGSDSGVSYLTADASCAKPPRAGRFPDGRSGKEYAAAVGLEVVWPDGKPMGHVLMRALFTTDPEARGNTTCFPPPAPFAAASEKGRICFAAGRLAVSSRTARVPSISRNPISVKGALDKDVIRRIVRAHVHQVRRCYNEGLKRDPNLTGRASIQFTIGPDGHVPVAVVAETDLADRSVANCIAKSVKQWQFPKPTGGGNVVVTYPFVLVPG